MITPDLATEQRHDRAEAILAGRLIAIVRLRHAADLPAIAEAIARGGITAIEFTLNTPGALEAVDAARGTLGGDVLIGAGTVTTEPEAMAAANAGAQFLVSPITNAGVIATGQAAGCPVLPGAYTPTEIAQAMALEAELIKLFPASQLGPSYVREVLAPLDSARLVPTGGVRVDNVATYLDAGAAALAVGSSVCKPEWVEARDYNAIEAAARSFREAVTSWEEHQA
jgi:2-dehydro-3-deoxyphosphogluconate aldolase/(4S)-4-hydroxy-2-oxoglutarate aldolase